MRIRNYLNSFLKTINNCPFVLTHSFSFDEKPPHAVYLHGSITFLNGSNLYFKEFVFFKKRKAEIIKYSYHFENISNELLFRYDNALDPKAKQLKTYPEHKHFRGGLHSAIRPSFSEIIKEITNNISYTK